MRVLWIALTSLAAFGHCYAFDPEGTPVADDGPPKEATGEIVNGVRCSLAADPDVFLTDISSGTQISLKLTLTNVGSAAIRVNTWRPPSEACLPEILGPDDKSVEPSKDIRRASFLSPTNEDIKKLDPGKSMSFLIQALPTFQDKYVIWRFDLSKPGRYRLRLKFPGEEFQSHTDILKECWSGTGATNYLSIEVLDYNSKGPQSVKPLLTLLNLCSHMQSRWAAERLALDAEEGVPILTRMLDDRQNPIRAYHAAYGLMSGGSRASLEVKRKAEILLLESLRESYSARGLYEPGNYLQPTEFGIRWLLANVPKADAPIELRRQGMRLLSLYATRGFRMEGRKIFLAALDDKDAETRQHAMNGLANLGAEESELPLYRRLAGDQDILIRRRLFEMLAGTTEDWATPLVSEGLGAGDEEIRSSCAWGVRTRKNKSLVPELIKMLKALPHDVRGNFPRDCHVACEAVVELLDLKGYDFEFKDGVYRNDMYRKECERLLKWWDSQHTR